MTIVLNSGLYLHPCVYTYDLMTSTHTTKFVLYKSSVKPIYFVNDNVAFMIY